MIKKTFIFLLAFFFLIRAVLPAAAAADKPINLYLFYGEGCPHCAQEEKFLDKLEKDFGNIKVFRYEVWHNQDNARLLRDLAGKIGLNVTGVPVLVIGDQTIVGYNDDSTTGAKIKSLVEDYAQSGCVDVAAPVLGITDQGQECAGTCATGDTECLDNCGCSTGNLNEGGSSGQTLPETIRVPFFGIVDISHLSLPALTAVFGATDGFNPCAMWVLLFLISLLLGMESRVRMWTLGSAFIITSAIVYLLFMTAWLNFFLFLGFVSWVRAAIAMVALGSGGYHLYHYFKTRNGGCPVIASDKRKALFARLRAAAGQKKFLAALGGVMALAFAVNLVELVCSLGLPAVYTQILAISNLSRWQHYGYLLLYIFFYMLESMLVFVIAMTTLKMKALSSRYTRWSGLVGGVVMLLIGILLLFRPGWLMFG